MHPAAFAHLGISRVPGRSRRYLLSEPTTIVLTHNGPPPLKRADILVIVRLTLLVDEVLIILQVYSIESIPDFRNAAPGFTIIRPFQGRGK